MTQKIRRASSGQGAGRLDKNKKELVKTSLAIVCAAFILLIPALLNGFPFIFPDSGDYLVFTPHIYRSPYYGLFIFFFHLNRWIWGPIIAQALIVSHLLWLLLKLNRADKIKAKLIFLAVLLTIFTSLPWFVGFIMADLFVPIMFIAMFILAFHYNNLSRTLRIYLVLLACIATAAHTGNLTMALGMFILFAFLLAWCGHARKEILQRLKILLAPIGLTASAMLLFNSLIFGSFSLIAAGPVFFMTSLIKYGPARLYLEKACPNADYKICAFSDRLPDVPNRFLWDPDVARRLGGFAGMKQESAVIVRETIKRYPLEVGRMIANNFLAGLITHEPAAEFRSEYQVPSMIDLLMKKFGPHAVESYLNSAEMRDLIPHDAIRAIDNIVTPLSFLMLAALCLFAARRGKRQHATMTIVMIAGVLGNTLLCTTISGIYDRYQARVTWLLPMAVFVIVCSWPQPASLTKVTNASAPSAKRRSK